MTRENIELVIKLSKGEYEQIKKDIKLMESRFMAVPTLFKIIENGTPLPKGHGKLKDENEIFECIRNRVKNLMNDRQFRKYRKDIDLLGTIPHIRNEVKTVIGADREVE